MKKLAVAALILSSLSGGAYAHEAGEFFIRAGSATVRPTEGSDNVLGMGGFNVSNNTQLGLTFTYMATDNIGVELFSRHAIPSPRRFRTDRGHCHGAPFATNADGAVVLRRFQQQGAPLYWCRR